MFHTWQKTQNILRCLNKQTKLESESLGSLDFLKQDIQIINDLPRQLMHIGHFGVIWSKNKTEDFSPLNL